MNNQFEIERRQSQVQKTWVFNASNSEEATELRLQSYVSKSVNPETGEETHLSSYAPIGRLALTPPKIPGSVIAELFLQVPSPDKSILVVGEKKIAAADIGLLEKESIRTVSGLIRKYTKILKSDLKFDTSIEGDIEALNLFAMKTRKITDEREVRMNEIEFANRTPAECLLACINSIPHSPMIAATTLAIYSQKINIPLKTREESLGKEGKESGFTFGAEKLGK